MELLAVYECIGTLLSVLEELTETVEENPEWDIYDITMKLYDQAEQSSHPQWVGCIYYLVQMR